MNRWEELLNNHLATGGCIIDKDGKAKWYRCYNDYLKDKENDSDERVKCDKIEK